MHTNIHTYRKTCRHNTYINTSTYIQTDTHTYRKTNTTIHKYIHICIKKESHNQTHTYRQTDRQTDIK